MKEQYVVIEYRLNLVNVLGIYDTPEEAHRVMIDYCMPVVRTMMGSPNVSKITYIRDSALVTCHRVEK